MKFNKEALVLGFAMFALFFGAGNLILPPFLGFFAGNQWWLVALGFAISAVGLPLLGILAHARLQGSVFNFGEKVSPLFSLVFSLIIYGVSICLPAPRTAAVTHEIAVQPFFNLSPLVTSLIYFSLVLILVIRRSSVVGIIGRLLTPALLLLLLAMVLSGIFAESRTPGMTAMDLPVLAGFFEGYQTFDAIGSLVVGGVIIVSVKLKKHNNGTGIRKLVNSAAVVAGLGLLLVYGGLIYNGALVVYDFPEDVTRTQLLSGISFLNLGAMAQTALAFMVALACFTTAAGIITGTADFMSERISGPYTYPITVITACLLGVLMGALSVNAIIEIALPILLLVYPITIVLILLNVLPKFFLTRLVFRAVVITTILFSLPDALKYLISPQTFEEFQRWIPLSAHGLGWMLPVVLVFLAISGWQFYRSKQLRSD